MMGRKQSRLRAAEVLASPALVEKIASLYRAEVSTHGLLTRFNITAQTLEKVRRAKGLARRARVVEQAHPGDRI
jgi:hypothetical protein